MTRSLTLTDTDLHAYLLAGPFGKTALSLQRLIGEVMPAGFKCNAAFLLKEKARRHGVFQCEKVLRDAFNTCPHNLAERLLEASLVYRLVGSAALPELLPLAVVLLRTDLHAYFVPSAKPYRDHLAHQTRVAALAHMLLWDGFPLLPWRGAVDRWLRSWDQSQEYALLVAHLVRLGLEDGMPHGLDERRQSAQIAALLAGLVHDLGYALKFEALQFGGAPAALQRLGIFPDSGPPLDDPPRAPISEMYRHFWPEAGPGSPLSSMQRYIELHPTSPHSLAGALWLALLPERLRRRGVMRPPRTFARAGGGDDPRGARQRRAEGRLELICQLAAMMALAHDFPVDSAKKQAEQGFVMPKLPPKQTLLNVYPLSSLFALADTLHEFGRPVVFTGPSSVEVRSPVRGIRFDDPDEWSEGLDGSSPAARRRGNKAGRKLGILAKDRGHADDADPRIEIFWVVEDLEPEDAMHSAFDLSFLGGDVPARLAGWGFDEVLCQRDVSAANDAAKNISDSMKLKRSMRMRFSKQSGSPRLRETVSDTGHRLALHPLSDYHGDQRLVRHNLNLSTLR